MDWRQDLNILERSSISVLQFPRIMMGDVSDFEASDSCGTWNSLWYSLML